MLLQILLALQLGIALGTDDHLPRRGVGVLSLDVHPKVGLLVGTHVAAQRAFHSLFLSTQVNVSLKKIIYRMILWDGGGGRCE